MDSKPAFDGIRTPKAPYFVNDKNGLYKTKKPLTAEQIIEFTKSLLADRFKPGKPFDNPEVGREWLRLEYQNHRSFHRCQARHLLICRTRLDLSMRNLTNLTSATLIIGVILVVFGQG